MDALHLVFAAPAIGPLVGIAAVAADARSGGRALNPGRLAASAAWGGALAALPAACVLAAAPHGGVGAIPFLVGVGGLYGAVVGYLAVGVRHVLIRDRDHTA